MPTDFWFRFSTYLSLVLACLCLGYAEWQLLPEVTAFTAAVILLLVASFLLDRRFELSLAKANALGLGIGLAAFVWMVVNLTRPRDGLAEIDWPTNMLPLIGPVLMALIPAKLFRPKHVGDWWAMHGVAVAGVALASSMSDDPPFVVLMAAYAVCSGWALVLFFYRRSGGFIDPIPVPHRTPPPQAQLAPADPHARPPRWVFARTLLWLAAGAGVAVGLFVALPRWKGDPWTFTRKRYVTGDTTENKLAVNKSGELTESDEVAFRVSAADADGNPKWDLDPDVHWRTREFVLYQPHETRPHESAWAMHNLSITYGVVSTALEAAAAGDLGPGGYTLRYRLEDGLKSTPLAAPMRWPADRSPVRWESGRLFPLRTSGQFVAEYHSREGYTQVAAGGDPPDLGTPFELSTDAGGNVLLQGGPPFFRDYARTLLGKLIAAGRLPPEAKLDARERVPEEHHPQVAREFAAYFAREGRVTDDPNEPAEFTYTTTLEPKDRKIDPLEDFLRNGKAGHCEWFAGATVLLLRGVGVRSQLVIGYRGWEPDENNELVVRQRQAHAWVEVLVSRPAPPDYPFRPQTPEHLRTHLWQWLTVDPTPGGTVTTAPPPKNWFEQGASFIAEFFLRFDKAKQEKAVQELGEAAAVGWPWAAGGLVAGAAGLLGRRWWKRWLAARPVYDGPPWYARLQAVLAARGFTRSAGQTPREFADATAAAAPHTAEVVQFVTSKLYRVRYAGMPLKPDEEQQVHTAIDRLERTGEGK